MNLKMLQKTLVGALLVSIFAFVTPIHATSPLIGPNNTTVTGNVHTSYLEIPSIKLSIPVVVAPFIGNTWDFTNLKDVAGFFEGLPMPGEGNNAIIGAHSELANRIPGPFYNLNDVKVNDPIVVVQDGVTYAYIVTKIWYVLPTDISPLSSTLTDMLTLFTCAGYDQGIYSTRLVVQAKLLPE